MNRVYHLLAFDLGASNGRAILGTFDGDRIEMQYQSAAPFSSGGIPGGALSSIPTIEIPVRCGGVVLFVMDVQQNERC